MIPDHRTRSQYYADIITEFSGSWSFIGIFSFICAIWILLNVSGTMQFDMFPFILLNLALTVLSTFQSPIILMSQNRQNENDSQVVKDILNRLDALQKSIDELK